MNRHRPAIGQLLSMWGALPGSVRRFASDFASVLAEEGRHVPARLAWTGGALAFAGMLLLTGWLLLCVATASWMAAEYGWQRETALCMVAVLNLSLVVIFIVAAYRSLKPPFFPVTSYELQRLRNAPVDTGNSLPLSDVGPKERALMQSEAELQARFSEVKRVTPKLLTTPSVIGATAGVGMLLGFVTSNGRKRQAASVHRYATNLPVSRQLLNVALGQLSSLALAVALRELQRRTGHDRQGF